uniref:Uncharacterized protein n=1 Tax=Rhizophora mucronata TaxID=61149 RepID=A0A2P2QDP8_RHIMU
MVSLLNQRFWRMHCEFCILCTMAICYMLSSCL